MVTHSASAVDNVAHVSVLQAQLTVATPRVSSVHDAKHMSCDMPARSASPHNALSNLNRLTKFNPKILCCGKVMLPCFYLHAEPSVGPSNWRVKAPTAFEMPSFRMVHGHVKLPTATLLIQSPPRSPSYVGPSSKS